MKRNLLYIFVLAFVSVLSSCSAYESYTDTARVNGVSLFYAVEGKGKPVILLHGNGGSHNSLETTARQLAQAGYKVYGIDSRGQGANKRLSEYHYSDMADDVYQFILQKKLDRPAIFGHSDGGIIALMMEVRHPGTAGLLVVCGANIFPAGLTPDFLTGVSSRRPLSPLDRMIVEEPSMTFNELKAIHVPTLVLAGEHDIILPEHTRQIAQAIPGSELRILSGENHSSYISHNRKVGNIILEYMKEKKY